MCLHRIFLGLKGVPISVLSGHSIYCRNKELCGHMEPWGVRFTWRPESRERAHCTGNWANRQTKTPNPKPSKAGAPPVQAIVWETGSVGFDLESREKKARV